jgi:hypothetical protein
MIDTTGKPGNPSSVMAEDAPEPGGEIPQDDQSETATLPLSMFGGKPVKEGDILNVKVISVDDQNGSVNVAMAGDEQPPQKPGSDGLAGQLDNKPPQPS